MSKEQTKDKREEVQFYNKEEMYRELYQKVFPNIDKELANNFESFKKNVEGKINSLLATFYFDLSKYKKGKNYKIPVEIVRMIEFYILFEEEQLKKENSPNKLIKHIRNNDLDKITKEDRIEFLNKFKSYTDKSNINIIQFFRYNSEYTSKYDLDFPNYSKLLLSTKDEIINSITNTCKSEFELLFESSPIAQLPKIDFLLKSTATDLDIGYMTYGEFEKIVENEFEEYQKFNDEDRYALISLFYKYFEVVMEMWDLVAGTYLSFKKEKLVNLIKEYILELENQEITETLHIPKHELILSMELSLELTADSILSEVEENLEDILKNIINEKIFNLPKNLLEDDF